MDEDLNARPLIDDEPDSEPDIDVEQTLLEELSKLVLLYDAVTAPEWSAMAGWLASKEVEALDRLIGAQGTDVIRWQTRIKVYRELLELPDTLARDIRWGNEALEGERAHAD